MRKRLGVNIDHVATIRQARMSDYPDPVYAAVIAELAGADSLTVHLREDRRHIQDRDVYVLRKTIKTKLNLEMSLNEDIIRIVLDSVPDEVCIVPERREEVTTEGGLDAVKNMDDLKLFIPMLKSKGIRVSLFVDPVILQIDAAKESGAEVVELHTGRYSIARQENDIRKELDILYEASGYAAGLGLRVNAGHGLNYGNVYNITRIPQIDTLNIGHSIISQAVFIGLDRAVRDMISILDRAQYESAGFKNSAQFP